MNPAVLALGALLALVPILGAEELLPADALAQATLTGATGQARTSWEASTGERLLTVATAQPRPWGVGLKIPLRQDLPVGTLVTLSAEVRLVAGERGSLHVGLQRHQPPWTKPVFVHTDPGRTWTVIRGLGQVTERLPAGGVDVVLHAGLQAQTLAVRRLQVGRWSRTEDLPPEFRTYAGREAEASWRGPAAERIARYRQAEVAVVVRDDQGRPVPGVPVAITQLRQAFPFGTAVDERALLEGDPRYGETLRTWFNAAVIENGLKAGSSEDGPRRVRVRQALEHLRSWGMPVRGHCAVWGREAYLAPSVQRSIGYDKARHGGGRTAERLRQDLGSAGLDRLAADLSAHVLDIVGSHRGLLQAWDVLNEPALEPDLPEALGTSAIADWYRLARRADPQAKLYVNEQNLWGSPDRAATVERLVRDLRAAGAPIDGIGEQGHIRGLPPGIPALEAFVDRFGALGLELTLTEYDFATEDHDLAADWLRDCFTYLYSRPEVVGLYQWGFWAGQHWLPEAALFDRAWQERPAARAYRRLVLDAWRTEATGVTDATGTFRQRAFLGRLRVAAGARTQEIDLGREGLRIDLAAP